MFQELGPDLPALPGVVAFFSQDINESNLEWLFPTIFDGSTGLGKFSIPSLTHWGIGFITMFAALRDYLTLDGPELSLLLCTTKQRYFTRMSIKLGLDEPSFEESR